MNYLWRCIIIPSNKADLTRQIWATLDPAYNDEFKIGLASLDTPDTITHYMSAGWVPETSTKLMPFSTWALEGSEEPVWALQSHSDGRPSLVAQMCSDALLEASVDDVVRVWATASVTDEPIDTALGRLGLVRWSEPMKEEANDAEAS